jgi:hypothetical protein
MISERHLAQEPASTVGVYLGLSRACPTFSTKVLIRKEPPGAHTIGISTNHCILFDYSEVSVDMETSYRKGVFISALSILIVCLFMSKSFLLCDSLHLFILILISSLVSSRVFVLRSNFDELRILHLALIRSGLG